MKTREDTIQKIVITEIPSLDPVTVFVDDRGVGKGAITLLCFGQAWTMWGGALGNQRIVEFFCSAHDDYLAGKLSSIRNRVIDYDQISRDIGEEVDVTSLMLFADKVAAAYGADWMMDLPEKDNPDHVYLRRIIRAAQAGLKEHQAAAA